MNFFSELKRRNVYKVAITYAVVAWLLIQAASILLPTFEAPTWVMKAFVVFLAFGFVISVMISWAFEATPQGLKRTEDVSADVAEKLPTWSPRKFATFVIAVAVIAAGLLAYQFLRPKSTGTLRPATAGRLHEAATVAIPQKSIAVLPFENLSRDPDNAYFTEGVQDEILTRLAKIADLKVISRMSTQRYKSSPDNLPQIAQELGVEHILEGSVQKADDQVRVTVKLINALSNTHVWGESFDRKLTDIFAVESEVAKMVADRLQAKLTGTEQNALTARPTDNAEAYQLYLRGRYFWNKRTGADLKKAIDYFDQAIGKDPNYALAYAGLADAYVLMSGFAAASPTESLPKAKEAARRALELDSTLGEAHASLAQALFAYDFNFAEANLEFRRAIELSPNYATGHHWYAQSGLLILGQFDDAIAEMKRALELDPLSVIINADLGNVFFHSRRYDEAIEQLRKTLEMEPGFYYARWNLGQALEMKGLVAEAIAEYEQAIALNDDPVPLGLLGHLYASIGKKDKALEILERLREMSQQGYVSPYNFALIHLGLGQKDETMRFLEKTFEERDGYSIALIKNDPILDPLRGDPRFEAFVEKVFAGK